MPYRNNIEKYLKGKKIEQVSIELDYSDDVCLYKKIIEFLSSNIKGQDVFRFNYTTSPRDIIWYTLHYLQFNHIHTELSYYRPDDYAKGHLSCNAGSPRLIIKRSGIVFPDKHTCVLALSGFDAERLAQINHQFEPKKILIGRQTGAQFENLTRNVSFNSSIVEEFPFDCYDISDSSLDILKNKIVPLIEEYNVIASALGPKPCAVTLFDLYCTS